MRPDRYIHESVHHDAIARCEQLTVTVDKFIAALDEYLAGPPTPANINRLHRALDNLKISNTKARKIEVAKKVNGSGKTGSPTGDADTARS